MEHLLPGARGDWQHQFGRLRRKVHDDQLALLGVNVLGAGFSSYH
jgi:hypothetical protein